MAVTYSIDSGADAAKFNIDTTTGVLTFKVAPDFENPGDADKNNIYEVTVKATDPGGASTTQALRVTVTDVIENTNAPPQFTSAGAVNVAENTTSVITVVAVDPDGGGTTPPPSTYTITIYVDATKGNDGNVGSQTSPLKSLQAAANKVKPGDVVGAMTGTYKPFTLTTSGTAAAPIVITRADSTQTPTLNTASDSSGQYWNGMDIQANYITIDGFTVIGNAAAYTKATADAAVGQAATCTNGIYLHSNSGITHHCIVQNCTVYNQPGGGIATGNVDYVQILNNITHNCCNWSTYGCSGISVYQSKNLDSGASPRIVVKGNTSYNNVQLVGTNGVNNQITDGEGIIADVNDTNGYTGGILIDGNTCYSNGNPGIESFRSTKVTISNNHVYSNSTLGLQPAANKEIFINQSTNNTVTNNNTSP